MGFFFFLEYVTVYQPCIFQEKVQKDIVFRYLSAKYKKIVIICTYILIYYKYGDILQIPKNM